MITVDSNNIWPRCSVDQISNYEILLVNMTCLRGSAGDGGGGGSVWLYYVCTFSFGSVRFKLVESGNGP